PADVEQLHRMLAGRRTSSTAAIGQRLFARLHWLVDAARRFRAGFVAHEPRLTGGAGFLLVACVLSLPLVWNPGYFSHDELQWLAFADQPTLAQIHWSAWVNLSPFQYRPLTFNL